VRVARGATTTAAPRASSRRTPRSHARRLIATSNATRFRVDGKYIELRPLEFRLLAALFEAPGHTFTREELLARLWQDAAPTPRVSTRT